MSSLYLCHDVSKLPLVNRFGDEILTLTELYFAFKIKEKFPDRS